MKNPRKKEMKQGNQLTTYLEQSFINLTRPR